MTTEVTCANCSTRMAASASVVRCPKCKATVVVRSLPMTPKQVIADSQQPPAFVLSSPAPYQYTPYVRRDDGASGRRAIACAINLIMPGLGQIATGRPLIGTLLLLLWLCAIAVAIVTCGFGAIVGLPVWIWAMIDAAALTK